MIDELVRLLDGQAKYTWSYVKSQLDIACPNMSKVRGSLAVGKKSFFSPAPDFVNKIWVGSAQHFALRGVGFLLCESQLLLDRLSTKIKI